MVMLRVCGAPELMAKARRQTKQQGANVRYWRLVAHDPLGSPDQLQPLLRLFDVEGSALPRGWILRFIRDGQPAEEIDLSFTPQQLGFEHGTALWLDALPPRASLSPVPLLPLSPALAGVFRHPHMVYIRIVEKRTKRGGRKQRVMLLTTKSIYLCHLDGHVTRWLRFPEVEEAVVLPHLSGDLVLLRCVPPEHDLLVSLVDHHNNLPVHATADELAVILHKSGVRITPADGDDGAMLQLAQLFKRDRFVPSGRKLDAVRAELSTVPVVAWRGPSLFRAPEPSPEGVTTEDVTAKLSELAADLSRMDSRSRLKQPDPSPPPTPLPQQPPPAADDLRAEVIRLENQHMSLARSIAAMAHASAVDAPVVRPDPEPAAFHPPPLAVPDAAPPPPLPAIPEVPRTASPPRYRGAAGTLRGRVLVIDTLERGAEHAAREFAATALLPDAVAVTGPRATGAAIRSALSSFSSGTAAGDCLVAVVSGRAGALAGGGLAPADRSPALSPDDVLTLMASPLPAGARLVVISDLDPPSPVFSLPYAYPIPAPPQPAPPIRANVIQLTVTGASGAGCAAAFLRRLAGLPVPSVRELVDDVAAELRAVGLLPVVMSSQPIAPEAICALNVGHKSDEFDPPPEPAPVLPPYAPVSDFGSVSPPRPGPCSALVSTPMPSARVHSAAPQPEPPEEGPLALPLQAPFARPSATAVVPREHIVEDQEVWRNLVLHAFVTPSAFDQPLAQVTSGQTGVKLQFSNAYVTGFMQQWPNRHPLRVSVRQQGPQQLRFRSSPQCWLFIRDRLAELLDLRAVQRSLYPYSKDASRRENVAVSVDGGEEVLCHSDDWAQAVGEWEGSQGFSFTQTMLPVPLMPPFRLLQESEWRGQDPYTARIAASLRLKMQQQAVGDPSMSFQCDSDVVRNLAYHSRLTEGARAPPHFVLEDASLRHPLLVNQAYMLAYVQSWTAAYPHTIWVHDSEHQTLVARCRVDAAFWRFLCDRGPVLQNQVDGGRVVAAPAGGKTVCHTALHLLSVTSSVGPDALSLWDGVWCAVVADWEARLPQTPAALAGRAGPEPQVWSTV
eukprot:TRINITY_DN26660_c0_g1_i1.p1 TRINITY_DN26660_c0_g1~~TRINITY_DN26660_c0_g1_i1.p1  ORF type:complete len:1093 (+),score=295.39 TRINITY_DN26660_c0_g1_i1:82-3279(+)